MTGLAREGTRVERAAHRKSSRNPPKGQPASDFVQGASKDCDPGDIGASPRGQRAPRRQLQAVAQGASRLAELTRSLEPRERWP